MSVVIKVDIKKCADCRFKDHSGAFTGGGAKGVCGHSDAVKTMGKGSSDDRYHWRHRVIDWNQEPPSNCPLRTGSKY